MAKVVILKTLSKSTHFGLQTDQHEEGEKQYLSRSLGGGGGGGGRGMSVETARMKLDEGRELRRSFEL